VKKTIGILSLVYKGYILCVFVLTLILFYIPIAFFLFIPNGKKIAFYIHIWWGRTVQLLILIGIRKKFKEKLPPAPFIVIANHASYLDIFLMYSIFPKTPFLFLGKSEILSYPLLKTLFKRLNIPVFRKDKRKAAQSFILAKKALQQSWSLIIFPEGTIPDEGWPTMIPFKEGAFKLAKSAQVPLIPVSFKNNYKLFSDPECLLGPARPGISTVIVHPAIDVETINAMETEDLIEYAYSIIDSEL
jgi:1-acyl-sn-glycerol-3-phosphate acyltransferase